jgi:hypothetical protein
MIATGSQKKPSHGVRFTVRMDGRLDRETFDEVKVYAERQKTSVSEAIRLLVEFGLETVKQDGGLSR